MEDTARMRRSRYRKEHGRGGRPFVATLWATILLALLCALAPLGAPSSQQTGSAFNAATLSVALRAREPAMPQAQRATNPDGAPRSGTMARAIMPALMVLALTRFLASLDLVFPTAWRFSRQAGPSAYRARAPPSFR